MYAHFKIPPQYKGPCSGMEQEDIEGIIYNSYYQWVPIYLIILAVFFYLPRVLWLVMEGGLMKFFGKGTTTRIIEDPEEKRDKLVEFFRANIHNKYNIYYYGFIFCELMNILVLIGAFFATDRFLEYRWRDYGFRVWTYYHLPPEEQRMASKTNPMCYTFPRIAACTYYRFGTGGKQENIEALCILSLNIINDKVFLVIWWWFFVLFFLGFCRMIFRVVQIISVRLRFYMLNMRMHRYFKRNENMVRVRTYVYGCSRGDWFVLYQLSKNLNRPFFMEFLVNLSKVIEAQKENPNLLDNKDEGDGIMDMMLKPALTTYESREAGKGGDDDDSD